MEDVLHQLQVMKQTQEEAIEVQRRGIQIELEKVSEELQQVKLRSIMLEEEIKSLKTQKQTPKQQSNENTPVIEKDPGQPSTKWTEEKNTTTPSPKSYAQIAALILTKNVTEKSWTEVTSISRRKKSNPIVKKFEEQIGGAEHVCTSCLFFYLVMRRN